jgi:MYXO-CTERM domain-containing protein
LSYFTRCIASLLFVIGLSLPSTTLAYTLKRTVSGDQIRWTRDRVALHIDPALEQMLGRDRVRAAAAMASDSWRGFPGVPDLAIEEGAPPAYDPNHRGDSIYLLQDWPFEDNQLAVTLVTFEQNGKVLGVDVLVNADKSFALLGEGDPAAADHYDIAAVLTHEFGHVLGLDESFEHPEATMWPQIRVGEFHQRVLSVDDEDGVIAVYQAPMPKPIEQGCSVTAPNARGASNAFPIALLAFAGVLLARRSRRSA